MVRAAVRRRSRPQDPGRRVDRGADGRMDGDADALIQGGGAEERRGRGDPQWSPLLLLFYQRCITAALFSMLVRQR